MSEFDLVVIGAGAAGEAATFAGAAMDRRVAVIERDLIGGECAFWACVPTKSLLDSAGRRALGAPYSWPRASDRRDWNISREKIDYPDDSGHADRFGKAGARLFRGTARVTGPDRIEISLKDGGTEVLSTGSIIVATGSVPVIPEVSGLEESGYWTNREATSSRSLLSSLVVMGGGPMGVEAAQIFTRFGCRVTLLDSNQRILAGDHPSSSKAVTDQLVQEGVDVRVDISAEIVEQGGLGRIVTLSDGSTVEGAELLVAVGRRPANLRDLGLEEAGIPLDASGAVSPDRFMSVGPSFYVAGDAAGGLQFTHLADYEGRVAAKNALGGSYEADISAVPRSTFTDPETAAVGLTLEEAEQQGIDAFEVSQDFANTARGNTIEGSSGHVTLVVDRERSRLAGAFAACPGASELIHVAVLAIKQRTPLEVLADAIYQFPTGARVFGNLAQQALDQ